MAFGKTAFRIHPAGWPFIGLFALATLVLALFGWPWFFLGIVLTAWCVYFFRDPARVTPSRTGLIVSPADGCVVSVGTVMPDPGLGLGGNPCVRISIFLNVFDVHVNRCPADGKVSHAVYRAGKFFNASLDKASADNERMALAITLTGNHPYAGQGLGFVQIAGLIARRIVCTAKLGQDIKAGERYGLIRFGSRADVYLPSGLQPLVAVGQRMIGGETVLADCLSAEAARQGEVR
ncbi:MAG: phosphatidylserine decarboxylase [Alphaproteobacteria bacterium]|nr:phosphatidylserine decarboxylase [Alphaproteobacteria bacterium]